MLRPKRAVLSDPHDPLIDHQPYWEPEGGRGPLSGEDLRALDADLMPPGASRAGIRTAELVAKVALSVGAVGCVVLGVGLWSWLGSGSASGDRESGVGLVIVGALLCLGFIVGGGSLASRRRYTQVPLARFRGRLVDIGYERMFRSAENRATQMVLRFDGGERIYVPTTANYLGAIIEVGRDYELWFLPKTLSGADETLIYLRRDPS